MQTQTRQKLNRFPPFPPFVPRWPWTISVELLFSNLRNGRNKIKNYFIRLLWQLNETVQSKPLKESQRDIKCSINVSYYVKMSHCHLCLRNSRIKGCFVFLALWSTAKAFCAHEQTGKCPNNTSNNWKPVWLEWRLRSNLLPSFMD